jgi:hypothetical protein
MADVTSQRSQNAWRQLTCYPVHRAAHRRAETMIHELEQPVEGTEPLHFPDKFAVSRFSQLSTILWKNRQVYWRYTGMLRWIDSLVCWLLHGSQHIVCNAAYATLTRRFVTCNTASSGSNQNGQ